MSKTLMTPMKLAFCGNPNSGKSSLFNKLTGQRQKVANYPGVTVDVKFARMKLSNHEIQLFDLPGTYSFYPSTKDELVVSKVLANPNSKFYPDGIVYICDSTQLDKQLLLLTQILELKIPCILALNMSDLIDKARMNIDVDLLSSKLDLTVHKISSKTGEGIKALKQEMDALCQNPENYISNSQFFKPHKTLQETIALIRKNTGFENDYQNILVAHHYKSYNFISAADRINIGQELTNAGFNSLDHQVKETMGRFDGFQPIVQKVMTSDENLNNTSAKIDEYLVHPIIGSAIFFLIMLLMFQAIFAWSGLPMDGIEYLFGVIGGAVESALPESWFRSLLTEGIIAGLGGVLIFIPQIAILFFLISILEQSGYMARVVYLFDRFMQRFGMNGKSLIALVSSTACAIPAVMSTRTIPNWKERIITIMVAPLVSCSARIPVYVILIALVIPTTTVLGFLNLQGLVFFGLYGLGILAALLSALAFKYILKSDERSFLMLELPDYKMPSLRNVLSVVKDKVFTFVWEAGRIIMVISIVLWFLCSYGPSQKMAQATLDIDKITQENNLSEEESADMLASKKLEASYAGHLGKFIEPVIEPLGFDWKIGIALITSFAAREVFVGTMATIYNVGSAEDEISIGKQMDAQINPNTGQKTFTFAVAMSLLIFYVFAMQCMSTLAVVRKETNSWKWPMIQFVFMTLMAYFGSMITYQFLS
jgi:ferrous iron transport protein B